MLKSLIKKIIKPLYKPFYIRFVKPLIDIQTQLNTICDSVNQVEQILSKRIDTIEQTIEKQFTIDSQTTEARIHALNQAMEDRYEEWLKTFDSRVWKAEKNIILKDDLIRAEIHRHIEYTYRDILIVLDAIGKFVEKRDVIIKTTYPIAYESLDHLFPRGTKNDNTRYPRFIYKCEALLSKKEKLSFCDLGCSGGGMVLDAALRGHFSLGVEGSDLSLKAQRAEWRLLGQNLFTADITKPFELFDQQKQERVLFDIITAWEVLEHLSEAQLIGLFDNVSNHLGNEGLFVGSIANYSDKQPESGAELHIIQQPYEWWEQVFSEYGFEVCTSLFNYEDLARGGYNSPIPWEKDVVRTDYKKCFWFCCRKR